MMRCMLTVCAVLYSGCTMALAQTPQDDVEFKQQSAKLKSDYVQIGVSIQNISSHFIHSAYVDCAAIDAGGDIVETGIAEFNNLRPNERAYDFASFTHVHRLDLKFECRVSQVSRE